ncbi:hypothetical protein ACFQAT_04690 [Undibacterium arcticum]|uniref:Uncharacterized protein n=1 Tax=Undibacterium arcticum TaxID=1762892 RepID=A0ABV7F8E8_9BURK
MKKWIAMSLSLASDAFPCRANAKGNMEKCLINPALQSPSITPSLVVLIAGAINSAVLLKLAL